MERGHILNKFPPPPAYFQLYGDPIDIENVEESNKDVIRKEKESINYPRNLNPPKPPEGSEYVMFGGRYSTKLEQVSLEESGREKLYAELKENKDVVKELHKLHKSMLFKYLLLLKQVTKNNSPNDRQYEIYVQEIELMLINIHHLINTYRPHQARQTVLAVLQHQNNWVDRMNELKSAMEETKEIIFKAKEMLHNQINIQKQQDLEIRLNSILNQAMNWKNNDDDEEKNNKNEGKRKKKKKEEEEEEKEKHNNKNNKNKINLEERNSKQWIEKTLDELITEFG